jgi:hypothetical protein
MVPTDRYELVVADHEADPHVFSHVQLADPAAVGWEPAATTWRRNPRGSWRNRTPRLHGWGSTGA